MAQIDRFITGLIQNKASDLHIRTGARPMVRQNGVMVPFNTPR